MCKGRVLILASFIGSGHKKAAEAVELALKEIAPDLEVRLINFFAFAHPGIARAISSLYFKLLHTNPKMWDYLYDPREGKAKIAELAGLRGMIEGMRMKRAMECAFDESTEKDFGEILKDVSLNVLEMRDLLQMLGAKPEVSEKIYVEKNDRFRFPYSLIERKLRLLRKLACYLLIRMEELIEGYDPQVVVCTQVLPCLFVDKLKEKKNKKIPLIAILTDFGVHSYWVKPHIDAFVVPSPEVANTLLSKGIPDRAIYEYGIPIDKKFSIPKDKLEMRRKLGFSPDLFTVLVMGGGTGFVVDLSKALKMCERKRLPIQIAVVAGENEELRKETEMLRDKIKIPIFIYGFVDNVDELMAASDLLVTKPGGLSVSEAMVSCLPMVLVKVIQGQEENNMKFLLQKRAAVDGGSGRRIGSILLELYRNSEKMEQLRRRARSLAYPDSAANIARLILSYLPAD